MSDDFMLPRITVVTPSYNQAPFLEATLRSVLDQDYPALEYFVMDGGSTDDTVDILRQYSHRLTYWRSHPDAGQAAAIAEGFSRADGDILCWVNSDDLLAEGALRRVATAWTEAGGGVIVAGACRLFGPASDDSTHLPTFDTRFDVPVRMEPTQVLDLARHWFPGEFFYQPEIFFPRAAYEAVGGIDPSYYYTMDYDLWVRFALAGVPVVRIKETLAWYREHEQQKTADRKALYREMVTTANRYLREAPVPWWRRYLLAASNRAALLTPVREGWKLLRRLLERLP